LYAVNASGKFIGKNTQATEQIDKIINGEKAKITFGWQTV
jgi:hypothetical protein